MNGVINWNISFEWHLKINKLASNILYWLVLSVENNFKRAMDF